MSHAQSGIYFFPSDWLNETTLRSCSPADRGIAIDLICLMHESETYGVLKFGDVADWRYITPTNPDRDHLAQVPGRNGRPKIYHQQKATNNREITGREPGFNRDLTGILPVFRQLEKRLGVERNVIARCIDNLLKNGVFSLTSDGYIYCRRMVRDKNRRAAWRSRQNKRRQNVSFVTPLPIPIPISPYSPPLKKGDAKSASVDSEKPKPRLRKSEARQRAAMQVGLDPCYGAGEISELAQFRDDYFAAGKDPAFLVQAMGELFDLWQAAPRVKRGAMIAKWRPASSSSH